MRARTMWPTPPGALRVRPLPRESAASYLTRLATAYQITPAQLLDGLHITATGTSTGPPATEIHLSNEATRRLS
ncbi:TniQ family protein, partial [Streptomyces sp. NPDC005876]|uniref:TniQ family protein n=1 Tax=Streptomyces sp. NPDC005876 TaxID=3157076 RepID=UPI0033EC7914